MASENTSSVNEDRMGLDDSEPENEEYYGQRTYDRQSKGADQSQNLVSRGSSNITHVTDRMAATYLLQLRERDTQNLTDQAPVVSNSSSRYQHVVPPDNSNTNPSQYMYTSMSNSLDPQGMIYSEANMKNTVAGLSNAIAIMQQQQATMEIKQGTISSTLTNVMTLLQDLAN